MGTFNIAQRKFQFTNAKIKNIYIQLKALQMRPTKGHVPHCIVGLHPGSYNKLVSTLFRIKSSPSFSTRLCSKTKSHNGSRKSIIFGKYFE